MSERDGKWYYLSAGANMYMGNKVTALEHAKRAVEIEPGNEEYRQAAEQMSGIYQQTHTRTMGGGNDLLCNICQCMACMSLCGGGRLFCCF